MLHHHSGDCVQVTANLFSDRLEKVEDASGVWTAFTTYITKVCSLTQSCTMEVQKERKCIWCPCELYWYVFISVNTKLRCVFFENGFVRLPHICFPPQSLTKSSYETVHKLPLWLAGNYTGPAPFLPMWHHTEEKLKMAYSSHAVSSQQKFGERKYHLGQNSPESGQFLLFHNVFFRCQSR